MSERQRYSKVKAFLVEHNIRHKEVADVIGSRANTVSKKLNRLGSDFTLEEAKKMHFELGVPILYFFEPVVPIKERIDV